MERTNISTGVDNLQYRIEGPSWTNYKDTFYSLEMEIDKLYTTNPNEAVRLRSILYNRNSRCLISSNIYTKQKTNKIYKLAVKRLKTLNKLHDLQDKSKFGNIEIKQDKKQFCKLFLKLVKIEEVIRIEQIIFFIRDWNYGK